MMNVFLTGGTGFTGRPLARRMVERGWQVTALVRNPEGVPARSLEAAGVKLVMGDVTDRESMREAMTGSDIVVHNAAWYEFGVNAAARAAMQKSNVDGTEKVLSLASELNIARTVHVSSLVAYAGSGKTMRDESHGRQRSPLTFYAKTKAEAHDIAVAYQERGLPLIIASPGVVIGPNDHSMIGHLVRLYVNGWLPPILAGKETLLVQATAEDTAEGIVLAAEKGRLGEPYLVCGDVISAGEMFGIWGSTPGEMRVRGWMPTSVYAWLCAPLGPLLRAMGMSAFLSYEAMMNTGVDLCFSNVKARQELGWAPQSPQEAWPEILAAERALMKQRRGGSLTARLSPLDI
jgi:dihydroflavonol-4-reductase